MYVDLVLPGTQGVGPAPQSSSSSSVTPAQRRSFAPVMETARLSESTSRAEKQTSTVHTVKQGETLSHIVRDYFRSQGREFSVHDIYTAVRKISDANWLTNPDRIFPGQQLNLEALAAPAPEAGSIALGTYQMPERSISLSPPQAASEESPLVGAREADIAPVPATYPKSLPPETADALPGIAVPAPAVPPDSPPGAATPSAATLPEPASVSTSPFVSTRPPLDPLSMNTPKATAAPKAATVPDLPKVSNPWKGLIDDEVRMTSHYGMRRDPFSGKWAHHDGIDLAAPFGAEVRALMPGTVTFSGWNGSFGNMVLVEHENGLESLYSHTAENAVRVGDEVSRDTVLGVVGSTGRSTGPHLHFEMRRHGTAVNPLPYIARYTKILAQAK